MRKPTIYNIRHGYEQLARVEGRPAHFFDRETLRFFHETMKDLTVVTVEEGKTYDVLTTHGRHTFEVVGTPFDTPYFRLVK